MAWPRVYAYVDGFNLYYGSLRNTPYRWLDLSKLVASLAPGHDVRKIWYFTAEPKQDPANPGKVGRHREYMRALETISHLEIKAGFYAQKRADQRRAQPLYPPNPRVPNPNNPLVDVWKNEEKGSDVNLATALLIDAAAKRFDVAWVLSNDADLAWPIERARAEYGVVVGVFKPERPACCPTIRYRRDSWHLAQAASFFKRLTEPQLAAAQFPDPLFDAAGHPIIKPRSW